MKTPFICILAITAVFVISSAACGALPTAAPSPMTVTAEPAAPVPTAASSSLRFARIVIPDQVVGGKILAVVYGRLNLPIELVDIPANRALAESSVGNLDGEVQRNIKVKEQYPTLLPLEPPINYIEPSVFSKKYTFTVNGWESIKDYKICIVRGVGSSEAGTKGMKQVLAVETLDQCLQMVDADRVDVAVSDLFSGLVALQKLNLEVAVKPLSPPLQKIYVYHFLHEKHKDLIPKVNKVLQDMQASGELEKLRKQYIDEFLSQQK